MTEQIPQYPHKADLIAQASTQDPPLLSMDQLSKVLGLSFSTHGDIEAARRTGDFVKAEKLQTIISDKLLEACRNNHLPEDLKPGDEVYHVSFNYEDFNTQKLIMSVNLVQVAEINAETGEITLEFFPLRGQSIHHPQTGEDVKGGIRFGYITGLEDPLIPKEKTQDLFDYPGVVMTARIELVTQS